MCALNAHPSATLACCWNSADRNGKEGEIACEEKGGFKCLGFEVVLGCQVSLSNPDAGNPPTKDPHTRFIFALQNLEKEKS